MHCAICSSESTPLNQAVMDNRQTRKKKAWGHIGATEKGLKTQVRQARGARDARTRAA